MGTDEVAAVPGPSLEALETSWPERLKFRTKLAAVRKEASEEECAAWCLDGYAHVAITVDLPKSDGKLWCGRMEEFLPPLPRDVHADVLFKAWRVLRKAWMAAVKEEKAEKEKYEKADDRSMPEG